MKKLLVWLGKKQHELKYKPLKLEIGYTTPITPDRIGTELLVDEVKPNE